jgi:hypothetical protein
VTVNIILFKKVKFPQVERFLIKEYYRLRNKTQQINFNDMKAFLKEFTYLLTFYLLLLDFLQVHCELSSWFVANTINWIL